MGTSYSRGWVHFKDERVGEWDDSSGVMALKGQGKEDKVA